MAKMEIKRILSDTISALCKSSLKYQEDIQIEGLIGITIDKTDVILVNINECFASTEAKSQKNQPCSSKVNEETKRDELPKPAKTTTNKESETSEPPNSLNHKILSETSHKECLHTDESGYTEVQKSIKRVQRPDGVVEQKEVEWKKYTADGELLEQRKVEEVQPIEALPHYEDDNQNEDEADGGLSNDYNTNNEDAYEDGYCEEEYNNNGYNDNFPHQYHKFSRPFSRGFPRRGNNRGTKRQAMPHTSTQQPFVKRIRVDQQTTTQAKGKKSQFQHFPYTKVVFQKPDSPQAGRRGAASSSGGSRARSNVQPNDVIFNNALKLVWEGKMTVNAAVEMFNLPEVLFKKQLSMNKANPSKNQARGGRGKGKAASSTNRAGDGDAWSWGEGGGYDGDPGEYESY